MAFEINIGHRTANVEMLNRAKNKIQVAVDDKKYEVDIVMVEEGVYSIICNGISYNVELVCNNSGWFGHNWFDCVYDPSQSKTRKDLRKRA